MALLYFFSPTIKINDLPKKRELIVLAEIVTSLWLFEKHIFMCLALSAKPWGSGTDIIDAFLSGQSDRIEILFGP